MSIDKKLYDYFPLSIKKLINYDNIHIKVKLNDKEVKIRGYGIDIKSIHNKNGEFYILLDNDEIKKVLK